MKCPYCRNVIEESQEPIQYYPTVLKECTCGTIVDEEGHDRTKEYYDGEI
jgi:hypothetical protein